MQAGQDALHSAGVEGSEDAGARSKLPQPSQEEEALMCLLQRCICVSGPCKILSDVNVTDVYARGVNVNLTPLTSKRGALATDARGCSLWRYLLERQAPTWEYRVRDPARH